MFVGLILLKPIAQLSWEIWYASNIEYVAAELCENKEEPEIKCNGKCYLAKQLAKVENEKPEEPTPEKRTNPFQAKEEPPVLDQEGFHIEIYLCTEELNDSEFFYLCKPYALAQSDIFHPPQHIVLI